MKKIIQLSALASAMMLVGCNDDSKERRGLQEPLSANLLLNSTSDSEQLAFIDLSSPARSFRILQDIIISDNSEGHRLVSIDRRPQNGFLYALGFQAQTGSIRLFVLHPEAGIATPVGTSFTLPTPPAGARQDTRFEMDFNPFVDRLRVVSSLGENLRINPNTGALVMIDGNLSEAEKTAAQRPLLPALGTAYSNSAQNTPTTEQYTISYSNGINTGAETGGFLFTQDPPNDGVLNLVGRLGLRVPEISISAFDIPSSTPTLTRFGIAAISLLSGGSHLLQVNISDGSRKLLASSRDLGNRVVRGVALQGLLERPLIALSGTGTVLLRFGERNYMPPVSVPINGLLSGETLVGIDYRPATGQLFGLGVNSVSGSGTLYRLDPQTGSATPIPAANPANALTGLPAPETTGYGFDFNPTVDRIRITTGTGLNLRANPNNGERVAVDGALRTSTMELAAIAGAAYTNSYDSNPLPMGNALKMTSLYTLDTSSNQLAIQSPPNTGTQSVVANVTLKGEPLDFEEVAGFDIAPDVRVDTNDAQVANGTGLAILRVKNEDARLFRINLTTGAATDLGKIGEEETFRGLAIGITHAR